MGPARGDVVVSSTMLTVPEAARRVGRDPETVRRWIRSGRLTATKVGTQHVVEESDLALLVDTAEQLAVPKGWRTRASGEPQLNWVGLLHESRRGR